MAKSTAQKVAAVALQYSKILSKTITWFWIVYRVLVLVGSVIQPSVAPALVSTITGVDTAMLINEGTYLINSLGDKYIHSDRFVLSWINKGGFKSLISNIKAIEEEEKEDDFEEEDFR